MFRQRLLVIINKCARQGESAREIVQHALQEAGVEAVIRDCETPEHARVEISRLCREVDGIVLGGGDGTLNTMVEAVLESGLPMGVLPMGTANDLARTLEIPTELEAAARIVAAGRTTRIDLGWVNGKHYFNVANIGLGFIISRTLTSTMKKRWGVLAYPLSLFKAYASNRPFRAQIDCDGQKRHLSSMQIAVGNGRYYGGVMVVHEDAAIDDSHLHLYSIRPRNLVSLLRVAPTIVRGTFRGDDQILVMRGQQIVVHTNRSLPVSTDGELTTSTPAHFKIKKEALPLFVP